MLYSLFDYLQESINFPGAGVFQYLSFRASMAFIFSLLITIFVGKKIILTNGFVKKSKKTPKSEIELAESRRSEFLRRIEDE